MVGMKGLHMNKMLGSLKRKPSSADRVTESEVNGGLDTPEANATRNVKLFCESGGPNGSGEEVLYLPTIVESCESSPSAAKESAYIIRKFLSKDNYSKPYVQYNGIMLIRILSDNPGKTFTRNIDQKFVQVVKELLRMGRDPSVKQILMETLDTFQREKTADEDLAPLITMWKKEHERMVRIHGPGGPRVMAGPPGNFGPPPSQENYFARNHKSRSLPSPHELSSRIQEAKTSAGLLSQVVQSTPPSELLQNELVREFADRCLSASRSVQAYMVADNPGPDNDTMETLIETNEELSKAMSQHQRAVLNARKLMGLGNGEPTPTEMANATGATFAAPSGPPPGRETLPPARTQSGFAAPPGPPPSSSKPIAKKSAQISPPGDYAATGSDDENPFSDPSETKTPPFPKDREPTATGQFNDRLGVEPYHPGFKPTESYVGRQNSAVNGTKMSAGVPEAEEIPDERDREERRRAKEKANTATKSSKAPVYRY